MGFSGKIQGGIRASEAARTAGQSDRRLLGQDALYVGVRAWDDVNRNQFTNTLGSSRTGIRGCLDRTHIAPDHDGNISAANFFFAHEMDARGLDHGVRRFDGTHETAGLNHSESNSVIV